MPEGPLPTATVADDLARRRIDPRDGRVETVCDPDRIAGDGQRDRPAADVHSGERLARRPVDLSHAPRLVIGHPDRSRGHGEGRGTAVERDRAQNLARVLVDLQNGAIGGVRHPQACSPERHRRRIRAAQMEGLRDLSGLACNA